MLRIIRYGRFFSYDKKYRLIGIYEIPSDCFLNSVFDYNVNVMVRYPNIECVYLINYLTQIAEVTAFDITFVLKDEPIYPFSENLHQNDTTLIPLKRKIDRYRFPVNTFLLPSEEGDTTKVYTELDPSTKKFLYENVYEFVYPKAPYILVFFKENGRSRFIDHNYDTKTSKIYEGFTHTGLGKTHFQNANFRIEKNTIYVLWNSFLNISSPSEIKILKDALAGDTEGLNNLQIQGTDHIQPIVIKFKIREDSFLYRPY
ncbi:MAG: hypothetical protein LUG18_09180 [Candidatus Azobacteroides sp.]|nr:hypothetical protein [Candidatus Azobacteroides sp.]